MQIVNSGTAAPVGTVNIGYSTEMIKVRCTGTANSSAVLKFGQFTVALATSAHAGYEEIWGNFNKFTVVSGSVDWIAFG